MRKVSTGFLMLVFLLAPAVRAGQEAKPDEPPPRHRVLNLSLFYPVSMNRMKQDTANISLSLLYGHLGSVRGLDISLGAAALERSLEGIQLAGLIAAAGEFMTGVQASGLFSVAGDKLDGIQIAGLFNVAGEDSRALQVAGLMNVTGGTCRGLQVGLFNVAGKLTGVQIGLVNAADEIEGIPIGLVNLTRKEDRRVQMAAWAGSVSLFNAGVKIWAKRFYSILYVGGINLPQSIRECLGYGFQYGYAFPLRPSGGSGARKRIDVDAGGVL